MNNKFLYHCAIFSCFRKLSSASSITLERNDEQTNKDINLKGWLAIAKLKPLSLFISQLSMLKKVFDNVNIEE